MSYLTIIEIVQKEVKDQKGGFLSMLLGTFDVSLLGNLLTGRGIYRAGKGQGKGLIELEKDCKSWLWSFFVLCFAKY